MDGNIRDSITLDVHVAKHTLYKECTQMVPSSPKKMSFTSARRRALPLIISTPRLLMELKVGNFATKHKAEKISERLQKISQGEEVVNDKKQIDELVRISLAALDFWTSDASHRQSK